MHTNVHSYILTTELRARSACNPDRLLIIRRAGVERVPVQQDRVAKQIAHTLPRSAALKTRTRVPQLLLRSAPAAKLRTQRLLRAQPQSYTMAGLAQGCAA